MGHFYFVGWVGVIFIIYLLFASFFATLAPSGIFCWRKLRSSFLIDFFLSGWLAFSFWGLFSQGSFFSLRVFLFFYVIL